MKKKSQLSITLAPDVVSRVDELAKENRRSFSAMVEELLRAQIGAA